MTYYTRMRFNPNHVESGENGGEFTSGGSETGSAVTDSKGKPIIVYHGSDKNFDKLDLNKSRAGLGLYVTPNKDFAATFGEHTLEGQLHASKVIDLNEFGAFPNKSDIPSIAKLIDMPVAQLSATFKSLQKDAPDPFMFNLLEQSGFSLSKNVAVAFQDWGDGGEEPAYVFANPDQFKPKREKAVRYIVATKFNPNHVPDGPDGGQFTSGGGGDSGGGTSVSFEVAPDPNNKSLTKQWNKLSDANKLLISRQVAADILPGAMKALGTTGTLVDQIGGYLGTTNPSLSLEVDSAHAVDAAKLLGYALSQDSMMVVSSKAAPGLDKVGVVAVNLPEGQRDIASLTKIHDTLYALKDSAGEPVVTGFSSSHGRMDILNYSSVSDKELAGMVDKALGGKYEVQHTTGYSTFVEKKDYLNASSTVEGSASVWGKSASDLRDAASKAVEAHLQTHVPSGKTEGLKAVYVIQPRKVG